MANCGLKTKTEPTYKTTQISNDERQNNAMQIMKSLLSSNLGLTDYMAAGIVGNMWGESKWNPTAYTATDAGQGQSGGLCQWHDQVNGKGRFTNMLNFAKSNNKNWQDLQLQMAFLIDELNSKQKNALSALKNTDNVDDATTMFCRKFEVSSVCYPDGTPTDRIKKSKEVLEKWRQQH
jgi:hypothetical protein